MQSNKLHLLIKSGQVGYLTECLDEMALVGGGMGNARRCCTDFLKFVFLADLISRTCLNELPSLGTRVKVALRAHGNRSWTKLLSVSLLLFVACQVIPSRQLHWFSFCCYLCPSPPPPPPFILHLCWLLC